MENLTRHMRMIFDTDWKQYPDLDIVEVSGPSHALSARVFTEGDSLPLFKRNPGYSVTKKPVIIPFEIKTKDKVGLTYHVRFKLACHCRDTADLAKRIHLGEDPLRAFIERKKSDFIPDFQALSDIVPQRCVQMLMSDTQGRIPIRVTEVIDLDITDESTQFIFWLHSDEIKLKPVNTLIVKNGNATRALRDIKHSDVSTPEQSNYDSIRIIKDSVQKQQMGQDSLDIQGIELDTSRDERYRVIVEVRGRSGNALDDNIKRLRQLIIEHLRFSAKRHDVLIQVEQIRDVVLQTPNLIDCQALIDSVQVPVSPKIIYRDKEITFQTTTRNKEGFVYELRAKVNCRVIKDIPYVEEQLKSHLTDELRKEFRNLTVYPQQDSCEKIIERAGKGVLFGIIVDKAYVEVKDVTRYITINIAREGISPLKTKTGHTYVLKQATVHCRGSRDDEPTLQQIRARIESELYKTVQEVEGSITPVKVQDIILKVGNIGDLDATIFTVELPAIEDYVRELTIPIEVIVTLPVAADYEIRGQVVIEALNEKPFNENDFITDLYAYLSMKARTSENFENLPFSTFIEWIDQSPVFETYSARLLHRFISIIEAKESLTIELATDDKPIDIFSANRETYGLWGNIKVVVKSPKSVNVEQEEKLLKDNVIEGIKRYMERTSSASTESIDSECMEIAKKYIEKKKDVGIELSEVSIHVKRHDEIVEGKARKRANEDEITFAVESRQRQIKQLKARDEILYDHSVKFIQTYLENSQKNLENIFKERDTLYSQLKNKEIDKQTYKDLMEILDEREAEIKQHIQKLEFNVPDQETLYIVNKHLNSLPNRPLDQIESEGTKSHTVSAGSTGE
ncbi:MAG: hypothetical protein HQL06_06635 [Nitrospirae bacterium]|nr:hypothetical protein [Nitrospirota bacterium]